MTVRRITVQDDEALFEVEVTLILCAAENERPENIEEAVRTILGEIHNDMDYGVDEPIYFEQGVIL